MSIYSLYVKTHQTGLKYLGHTTKNPHTYKGSGKRWLKHLKKYGNKSVTHVVLSTFNYKELRWWGLYFSELWDVVESEEWANLMPECGEGSNGSQNKGKVSINKNKKYEDIHDEDKSTQLKENLKKLYAKNWLVTTPEGNTVEVYNLCEFCRKHHINKTIFARLKSNGYVAKRLF